MTNDTDALFREAVAAIDDGDNRRLDGLLRAHPELVRDRLRSPGDWLRSRVGDALDGFFAEPYLLWFVAEDPVRNDTLPPNIADVARTIIAATEREARDSLPEQLDYALSLVAWSWVAHRCGVQLELIDVLADAGAPLDGKPENALVNGHFDAARRLIERGAKLTLSTALLLERWDDAERLARSAPAAEKQDALVLAALNGRADALVVLLRNGTDVNTRSANIHAHATPLHHAVCSGSIEAVKLLVDAGADLGVADDAEGATPLGWAEYYRDCGDPARGRMYEQIAEYLELRAAAGRTEGHDTA